MDASTSCRITYTNPLTKETTAVELDRRLNLGRKPRKPGLVIAADDDYVSANAIEVKRSPDGIQVGNCSTHSYIEIRTSQGLRVVFPGEHLVMPTGATIMLRGSAFIHRIEIELADIGKRAQNSTGTKRLVEKFEIAEERRPALVLLCAAHFFPERFGHSPLKASEIAKMLSAQGQRVTAKAINNKLQRTRADIEAHTSEYIDDREALVSYLVRFGYVTLSDVRAQLVAS